MVWICVIEDPKIAGHIVVAAVSLEVLIERSLMREPAPRGSWDFKKVVNGLVHEHYVEADDYPELRYNYHIYEEPVHVEIVFNH